MTFVLDANVLMSILISGRAFYKTVLGNDDFITPEFALAELNKYNQLITGKTKLTLVEHTRYAYFVFSRVAVLPYYLLQQDAIDKAHKLIGDTDPKDVSYLALTIQTDTVLLTQDLPTCEAARRKGFRKITLFDEFLAKYT